MQVRCPNSGGYKVDTEFKVHDRVSNAPINWAAVAVLGFVSVVGLLVGIGYFLAGMLCSGIGSFLFAVMMIGLTAMIAKAYRKADKVERQHNICELCGYAWIWTPGDPMPAVTERPDLIAAGLQRLAQKAEEEEKRKKAAAELWYTQHGQK